MEPYTSPISCRTVLFLALPLLLSVSCTQDDRVATVTCDGVSEGAIPVSIEVSSNGKRASSIGYLNTWGLTLGTIVRTAPGSTPSGSIVEEHRLARSTDDLSPSAAVLSSTIVSDGLQVHLEQDIRTVARRAGVNLDSTILKHTVLYIGDPVVRSFRNLADSVNRDSGIVQSIRSASDTRFVIVSGTIDGDGLRLFNTYGSTAVNTFEIGGSYVHVSYSCPPVEGLGRRSASADGDIPIVIYMTPVRYDAPTSQVTLDPRATDFFPRK